MDTVEDITAEQLWDLMFTSIVQGDGPMLQKLLTISPVSKFLPENVDDLFFKFLIVSLEEKNNKTFIFFLFSLWNEYRINAEEIERQKFPKGKYYNQKVKELIENIDGGNDYRSLEINEYAGNDVDPNEEYKLKLAKYLEKRNSDDFNYGRLINKEEMNEFLFLQLVTALDISYMDSVKALYLTKEDNDISDGLIKISRVYGQQTKETYKELMNFIFPKMTKKQTKDFLRRIINEESVEYDVFDETMYKFLVSEMQKYADYAEIPNWILKEKITNDIVEAFLEAENTDNYFIPLPEAEEISKLIVKSFDQNWLKYNKKNITKQGLSVMTEENMEKVIYDAYESATNDIFRYAMIPDDVLEKVFFSKDKNTEAKKVLGLLNPFTYKPAEGESSRMYFCNTFLKEDEFGIKDVDWFTGNCDYCNKKIRHYYQAVRKPVITGGWIGCYCSWSHVRKSEPEMPNELLETFAPGTIVFRMIQYFENEIKKIGTYPRDDPPETKELELLKFDDMEFEEAEEGKEETMELEKVSPEFIKEETELNFLTEIADQMRYYYDPNEIEMQKQMEKESRNTKKRKVSFEE